MFVSSMVLIKKRRNLHANQEGIVVTKKCLGANCFHGKAKNGWATGESLLLLLQ